jgi:hypothetical protein
LQLEEVNKVKISRKVDSLSSFPEKFLTIPFENCTEEELFLNPVGTKNLNSGDNDFLLPTEEQGDERKELAHRSSELLWKQLSPYLATPAHLRLWNYPQLITTEETEKNESEKNKRMKVEELIKEESLEVVLMKEEQEEEEQDKEGEQEQMTLVNNEMREDITNAGLIPPSVPEQAVPPLDSAVESSFTFTQVGLDLLPSLKEIEQLQQESAFSFRSVEFFKDFPKNQDLFHSSHFLQSVDYLSSFYEALWSPEQQRRGRRRGAPPLMIATIDCEMCDTIHGLEVTRVTLLNQNQETIIDLLIKPDSPILDYRTPFSGMTAVLLNPIKTTLLQVQLLLARLIVNKTIVIGHSLENDLKGLKFFHEKVIDTTMLFPHPQGFPYRNKLKYLAKEYLQLMIQQQHPSVGPQKNHNNKKKNTGLSSVVPSSSGGPGHDSREDAAATLQLVLLKMSKGPSFGIPASEGIRVPLTKRFSYLSVPSLLIDYQPINSDLEKKDKPNSNGGSHFLESLICQGCRIVKKSNTEEIIEEIESFVKENQAHQKRNNEKEESSSSKKRSFGELEGKDGNEENDINRSDCDQPHFVHLSIPFRSSSSSSSSSDNDLTKTDNKEMILSFIKQLKERLNPSLPDNTDNNVISTHGLLLVTSQKSLQVVEEMISKKEKVFSNQRKMSSTIWSSKDEEILKNMIKETSLGDVAFQIL